MSEPETNKKCKICGAPVVRLTERQIALCRFCGREFEIEEVCEKGHFVCDECGERNAEDIITASAIASKSYDPIEIAIEIMQHPSIPMHGSEHHYLVPAVLLACYCNRLDLHDKKAEYLAEARLRASQVPIDSCGLCGACGAGIGTGIYLSILSGATPLSKVEWKLSNMITSESLVNIAIHGGPRCCKRDTILALQSAIQFSIRQNICMFDSPDNIACTFTKRNKECIGNRCPFFG